MLIINDKVEEGVRKMLKITGAGGKKPPTQPLSLIENYRGLQAASKTQSAPTEGWPLGCYLSLRC